MARAAATQPASPYAAPTLDCDLVMKGGITSGVVYPRAILELARQYSFHNVGGASAGAIAAAFAAAAEFGRRNGDPAAFDRLGARCDLLPSILGRLFQPSRPFAPLMNALLALSAHKGAWGKVLALLALWPPMAIGAIIAGALYALAAWGIIALLRWPLDLRSALPGFLLALVVGAGAGLVVHLYKTLFRALPRHNFGFCSGLPAPGATNPCLTEWLYESLQFIAFGDAAPGRPLTFGDLRRAGISAAEAKAGKTGIGLKMMTTNLSMGRPHVAPELNQGEGFDLLFRPDQWARLFPAEVMAYLAGPVCKPEKLDPAWRHIAAPDDLPVIIGVRTSLSFPILIETVPLGVRDIGARARGTLPQGQTPKLMPLLFSDGGISSNFPIHFFDALLPVRPTFAFSLDAMPSDAPPTTPVVTMPQDAAAGSFVPILSIASLGGFAGSILGAAKDWQDQMLSVMPGQRERIVHIALRPDQGGLNLDMPPAVSKQLMAYGHDAGVLIRTKFDMNEHRWRRTLTTYENLERTVDHLAAFRANQAAWYAGYKDHVLSYAKRIPEPQRTRIGDRIDALGAMGPTFTPAFRATLKFPRPTGRMRITPDV